MQRKPNRDVDDFINNAKDQNMNVLEKVDLSEILSSKHKTFPLSMPPELHKAAKAAAANYFPKVSLHDYILLAVKEKIERSLP